MTHYPLDDFMRENAEVEIRRWLIATGQWAPGAAYPEPEAPAAPGVLSAAAIERVLTDTVVGRIGCSAGGEVYVVPVAYAYHDGAIYGCTGPGRKLQMMRENPNVCFEVDRLADLTEWQSVIAWGRFEELGGEAAEQAMHLLLGRVAALLPSERGEPGATQPASAGLVVYRIVLRERTGRFKAPAR